MKKVLIIFGILIPILLICTAVVGILGTLVFVGARSTQKTYRETVRLNDLRNFNNSIEGYYAEYGVYPRLSDSAVLTSIEMVKEKKDISLNYPKLNLLDPNTGANTEFSFILTSPGLMIYTGKGEESRLGCKEGDKTEGNSLVSNPDLWQIFYTTDGNAPQRYYLLTCTENGMKHSTGFNGRTID